MCQGLKSRYENSHATASAEYDLFLIHTRRSLRSAQFVGGRANGRPRERERESARNVISETRQFAQNDITRCSRRGYVVIALNSDKVISLKTDSISSASP